MSEAQEFEPEDLLGETFLDEETSAFRWRIRVRALSLVIAQSGEPRGFPSREEAEDAGRKVRGDLEWIGTSPSGHPLAPPEEPAEDDGDDPLDEPEP